MNKTFTLAEAQALLPTMESLLLRAMEAKQRVEEIEKEFQQVNHGIYLRGGSDVDVVPLARLRAESDKAVQTVKESIGEIESLGAQVKDLDIGLLDFPCSVDDEIILLCWRLGEERIAHWHGLAEGFAGRKPIDDHIARAGK
jgi:hypothetical protein